VQTVHLYVLSFPSYLTSKYLIRAKRNGGAKADQTFQLWKIKFLYVENFADGLQVLICNSKTDGPIFTN